MALSRTEELTYHFYEWEKRGRGWYVFGEAVKLEPAFEPFYHRVPKSTSYVDDGKRPSLFAAPFEALGKLFSSPKPTKEIPDEPILALPFQDETISLKCFTVSFSREVKISAMPMEQLLTVLSTCAHPISFEIIATRSEIRLQFVSRGPELLFIKSQVKAYFPKAILEDSPNAIGEIASEQRPVVAIDLGLCEEFMRPLASYDKLDLDPLTGIYGYLEQLDGQDKGAIQILFQGASYPWAQSIIASVSDNQGECFFDDAPEMLDLAKDKVSSPLYAVVIRAIGESDTYEDAESIAGGIARMLQQVSQSPFNALVPLAEYHEELHLYDVLLRTSHRLGMILNSHELLTFVHFPTPSVAASKLVRDVTKTKAAPVSSKGHQFTLGINVHQGREVSVSVSPEQRLRHTHIIGATGTGKSTLLLNLIVEDIQQGNGFAVLDPHGDLIENILPFIPEDRMKDVILIDPSDTAYPVGFNVLTAHSEIEKDILSSDLVSVFRRLSSSWGDQMNSVLANAILAFLESEKGGTLMDLRRFLVEKDFREQFLETVTDPHIVYYWQKEYPLLKSTSIGPILTRLDTFLRPRPIRYMVGQRKGLDFETILDNKKILLIKLAQGLIGDENSYILGTTFVSKLYQAAMARQAKAKDLRSSFYMYVDEFQNFITPSMSQILAGARKYHLGLILAHQDMQQLMKYDSELASAVVSNAATRICFRLGDTDAKRFADGFSYFNETDLQNLSVGEAIARIERPENDFNLLINRVEEVSAEIAQATKTKVVAQSQKQNSTPKEEVDALFGFPTIEKEKAATKEQTPANLIEEVQKPVTEQPVKIELQPVPEKKLTAETKREAVENLAKQKAISQHRYLQTLIKKMAEARGYKATIEQTTPDGQGRVDVSLEKNGKKIACEIGVTTSKLWEVHNVEKCLAAGYEVVIAVPVDARARDLMQEELNKNLDTKFHSKVFVMEADALFHYMDVEVAKEATKETKIKGYRVKVEYDAVSEEEMRRKKESVTKFVIDSAKKKEEG